MIELWKLINFSNYRSQLLRHFKIEKIVEHFTIINFGKIYCLNFFQFRVFKTS